MNSTIEKTILSTLKSLQKDVQSLKQKSATKDDLKNFATKDDLKNFATKDDLKNFSTKGDLKNFATKDDLKNFATKDDLKNMATQSDIENIRKVMATQTDIKDIRQNMVTKDRFDKLVEIVLKDSADIQKIKQTLPTLFTRAEAQVMIEHIDAFAKQIDVYGKKAVVHDHRFNELEPAVAAHHKRIAALESRA